MQYMIIYKQSANTGAAYEKSNKDNNYNKYKMLIIVMKALEMVYDYVFNKK